MAAARLLIACCAVAAMLATMSVASAAMLEISPTRLDLGEGRRAAAFRVFNPTSGPVMIQVRGFRWTQLDGTDRLDRAPELIVNPPMFRLEPGRSQAVRVGLRTARIGSGEMAYRLMLDELPTPEESRTAALSMPLRVTLPLFIDAGAPSRLNWKVIGSNNGFMLEVTNRGAGHGKLVDLRLHGQDGREDRLAGLVYVLPGASRRFPIPERAIGGMGEAVRITAAAADGTLDQRVPVGRGDPVVADLPAERAR